MNFLNKIEFFRKINRTPLVLLIFVTLVVLAYGTAYMPVLLNVPFNVVFPALVLIFVKMVKFEKVKIATLLTMRVLILFVIAGILPGPTYVNIVLIFLIINIFEACATDLCKAKNYYNVVSGIALNMCVLFFFGSSNWVGPTYDAITISMLGTVTWIIAYTIWNFIFVTHEFSSGISYLHVAILTSPLVIILATANPGLWLITRANSLTIGGVIQISNKGYLEEKLKNDKFHSLIEKSKSKKAQIGFMLVNLALLSVTVLTSMGVI